MAASKPMSPELRRFLRRFGEQHLELEKAWTKEDGHAVRGDWLARCLLAKAAQVIRDSSHGAEHRTMVAFTMLAFFAEQLNGNYLITSLDGLDETAGQEGEQHG
jgi:hypothetical protein